MIRFEMTQLFFDSKKVRRSVDRATRRVLSRFGSFVRRTARSSIRKRKKFPISLDEAVEVMKVVSLAKAGTRFRIKPRPMR